MRNLGLGRSYDLTSPQYTSIGLYTDVLKPPRQSGNGGGYKLKRYINVIATMNGDCQHAVTMA